MARKHVVISIFDDSDNAHYRGGGVLVIEKVAYQLSNEFRTTVVTASRRSALIRRGDVVYRYLPVLWAGPRAGQLLFHALLPFLARRLPHDLWIESFTPPFSTSFLPLFSPAPVIGLGQQLSGNAMWRRYHIPFQLVERLGIRFYRNVVALNDADREVLERQSSAAVHVIPNGVEPRSVDEARLGEGEHILFLGRIDLRVKGLDLLLNAYTMAAPPLPLIVAGAGRPSEERKLAAMLRNAHDGVHWVGHVTGAVKQELLERSAFVVMPSRYEPFGIAALEAMSYGKPILHFDLPSLKWMTGGGRSVHPFDVGEFAAKLHELAADEALRRRLGRRAHLTAHRYTWNETTDRYLTLVRHVLTAPALEMEETG